MLTQNSLHDLFHILPSGEVQRDQPKRSRAETASSYCLGTFLLLSSHSISTLTSLSCSVDGFCPLVQQGLPIHTSIIFSPSQTLSTSSCVVGKTCLNLENNYTKSYQCSKWEVVKEICENLPHISISIPACNQHMTYLSQTSACTVRKKMTQHIRCLNIRTHDHLIHS